MTCLQWIRTLLRKMWRTWESIDECLLRKKWKSNTISHCDELVLNFVYLTAVHTKKNLCGVCLNHNAQDLLPYTLLK